MNNKGGEQAAGGQLYHIYKFSGVALAARLVSGSVLGLLKAGGISRLACSEKEMTSMTSTELGMTSFTPGLRSMASLLASLFLAGDPPAP